MKKLKDLYRKLVDKIFGKRCACDVKTACDHVNKISKKVKTYQCAHS